MSDQEQSIGAILRAAREARGMSAQDAAVRLRMMQRQIEAMETDDFTGLGQPVFARGFVRNYARLLGLDHEALLAAMGGDTAEPSELVHTQPVTPTRSWLASPWFILAVLGLVLLIAVPVALYVWLNSGAEEEAAPQVPPAAQPAALSPAPAVVPKTVAAPQAEVTAATDAAPASAAPPAPAAEPGPDTQQTGKGDMHFEFADDAWVEVKDASGRILHKQLNVAGSSVDVSGHPPFDLVVGNAAQVRMTYNGRPLDLKPYIDVTVARFSLEE